jgi:hypothetical protein
VGVTRTEVMFQPKVTSWFWAILKKDVAVCGGCVIVSPPAAAVWGMEMVEVLEDAVED